MNLKAMSYRADVKCVEIYRGESKTVTIPVTFQMQPPNDLGEELWSWCIIYVHKYESPRYASLEVAQKSALQVIEGFGFKLIEED